MGDDGRSAVSSAMLAGVVVVVLIAAVGGYLLLSQAPTPQASTSSGAASTSSSSTTSSSTSSSAAATTSTTQSTSSASSTSSSAPSFGFSLTPSPGNILLSPGSSYFYPSVSVAPATTSLTSSESVSLNSTLPAGITLSFESNPVKISPGVTRSVQMTFNVGQSVAPGDYQVTVGAKSGTSSTATTFTVHVVQYLVLQQGNLFVPDSLTVNRGATVFWINLDAPGGGDPEVHNVSFTSGATAQSPVMTQYATFSYTFSAPGTYKYYCTFHPSSMLGTITVTAM